MSGTRNALAFKEEIYLNMVMKYAALKSKMLTTSEKKEDEEKFKDLNEKLTFTQAEKVEV